MRRRSTTTLTALAAASAALVSATLALTPAATAHAGGGESGRGLPHGRGACPPRAVALGYSDTLDKAVVDGVTVGGLSDIGWDRSRHAFASSVDNHATDPSRIWFWRNPAHPHVVGKPVVLERPDGTPYDGTTADNEGLAVLPGGRFLVSSETEPSIRVFGRAGHQRATLPMPKRFAVAPAGQATANATLEGLTVTHHGREVVASMEGTLSGDLGSDGTDTYRRFLVYDRTRSGWHLTRQLGYQVEPGNRIAEVQAYGRDGLLVLEAAYVPATGNSVELYAVHIRHARDVTGVSDLADAPARDVMRKRLVADVTACPSMGAQAKEAQSNPLMDNFEGMTITRPWQTHRLGGYARSGWSHEHGRCRGHAAVVTLISDDNFSATQTTRVVTLAARLP
jgi:hypothetical protein